MTPISVLLVDDNPTFLEVASFFLQTDNGLDVVGTATDGRQALALAQSLQPQVILVDLIMPEFPGLELIPYLRELLPKVGIIALTVMDADVYRQAALAAGADDFVCKATMGTDLLPAIQRVAGKVKRQTPNFKRQT